MFKHKKTTEELEEDLEHVKLEDEALTHTKDMAEKKAVIKQLERDYGPQWKKMLGVSSLTDLSSLRSFLKSANQGMRTMSDRNSASGLSKTGNNPQLKSSAGGTAIGRLSTSFGNRNIKA